MPIYQVTFKDGAIQGPFAADSVMTSGKGDEQRVVLVPTQVNELASSLARVEELLDDGSTRTAWEPVE